MLSLVFAASCGQSPSVTPLITVDQFGWQPTDRKIAIFAKPISGQNAGQNYNPGASFQVRKVSDNSTVLTGNLIAWNGGATSADAGDKVWHADFSSLQTPGDYYVFDPTNNKRSYAFKIGSDVYAPVLKAATRMFYYNRCGTAITGQYGGSWTHAAGHLRKNQDVNAEYTQGGNGQRVYRDLRGGWYDAGDLNKYVPFLQDTLYDLLLAVELNPGAFPDTNNIPESGNGVPDMVDEIKWELDWLLRMQDLDGGINNRNGGKDYDQGDNPGLDLQPRFFTAKTSWATAIGAASMAQAARVFAPYGKQFPGYAQKLTTAAQKAWRWLEQRPNMTPADGTDGDNTVKSAQAESNANADRRARVLAAAQLWRLSGEAKFKQYVETWTRTTASTEENGQHFLTGGWRYVDPSLCGALNQAMFIYCKTPGADTALVNDFKTALSNTCEMIRQGTGGSDDPYLNFMWSGHYSWGSNNMKGKWARILTWGAELDVTPGQKTEYLAILPSYAHWIHGRNPLSWCYLSNMNSFGAEKSVMEIYHSWFHDGSPQYDGPTSTYGPAPGYLAGGPNRYFGVDWIAPPYGEPPMKAYKDWNSAWNNAQGANENSWEITEPAIYYQASYILALSQVMKTP